MKKLFLFIIFFLILVAYEYGSITQTPEEFFITKNLLFNPSDLYKPNLVKTRIDVTKQNEYIFKFKCKYPGMYDGGIILEKFESDIYYPKQYKPELKLKIELYDENGKLLQMNTISEKEYAIFMGKESGFSYFYFKCSKQVPLKREVTCKLSIIGPDKYLNDSYGPIDFFIGKMSDE